MLGLTGAASYGGEEDWLRRPAPQSVDAATPTYVNAFGGMATQYGSTALGRAPQPMMQYRTAAHDGSFDGGWGGSSSQRLVTSHQGNHGHDKRTTPWSSEQSAPWTSASSSSWTSRSNLTESMSGFLAEMNNPELNHLAWLSELPPHDTTSTLTTPENPGGDGCSPGSGSEEAETEEWEMYLNVPEDGSVEEGSISAGNKGFHYGSRFGSISLLLLYREIYAKFFWSITPLAAASMSEEMVRYALEANENDGPGDDLALRLNVFVGLAFGAIHSAHKELATQLIERAKSMLRAVLDYSDYAVAQALYAISVYCIYVEKDIDQSGHYMSMGAAICRDLELFNSDTFLRCIYGVSFLPTTSTQDMIRLRREYLNARKKPYHQALCSESVLESSDLPLIAVLNRGNTIGLLLLSVMSGLSIYKLRVEKNSSDPNLQQVGRERLLSLLQALKQLDDELVAEDESVEVADSTNNLKEDERLPFMDRMSFLICARALMVDCFRSLHSFDDALKSAAQLMRTMKRTARYMQFMYCGMQPMITIAVETYRQMCQWSDLRDLLDIVRPWATVYPLITDLYSAWTQLLEGKELTNQPLPANRAAVITSALDLSEESEGVSLTNGRVDRKRKQEDTVDVLCSPLHSASNSPTPGSGSESSTPQSQMPPLPAVIPNSTIPSSRPITSSMYISTPSATTSTTVPSYTPTSSLIPDHYSSLPTPTATPFTSRPLRSAPLATESNIDEPGHSSSTSSSSSPASSSLSETSSLPTPKAIIELESSPTEAPPLSNRTEHLATAHTSPKRLTTSGSKPNEKEGDEGCTIPPKKTDQWRWHKFAVVGGEELVQVKERRTRQRRRRSAKKKKEGSTEDRLNKPVDPRPGGGSALLVSECRQATCNQ